MRNEYMAMLVLFQFVTQPPALVLAACRQRRLWYNAGQLNALWGFSKDVYVQPLTPLPVTSRRYTAEQAAAATDEQLRANPVFRPYPSSITNSVIPLMTRAAHMTYGVPALTPPTGGTAFGGLTLGDEMVDLNGVGEGGISKPNGWPQGRRLGSRWTHSDMKDVAFYFVYKFYEKVVEKGGLK